MAVYRIWTRVTRIDGADYYLCVAAAVPEPPFESEPHPESESRVVSSYALAHESCASIATRMAERIRKRGDRVSVIEMV